MRKILNEKEVKRIALLFNTTELTYEEIGVLFGVSSGVISNLSNNRILKWKHLSHLFKHEYRKPRQYKTNEVIDCTGRNKEITSSSTINDIFAIEQILLAILDSKK
ncbi:MAG: hypothetical protein NTW30_05555 [Candidatus Aenigmarchaeota archaeon]|nr:hypothetical protein [Candidatus Aenigmarchaeota archaeon]